MSIKSLHFRTVDVRQQFVVLELYVLYFTLINPLGWDRAESSVSLQGTDFNHWLSKLFLWNIPSSHCCPQSTVPDAALWSCRIRCFLHLAWHQNHLRCCFSEGNMHRSRCDVNSDRVGLQCRLEFWTSEKFPSEADAAHLEAIFPAAKTENIWEGKDP